MAQERTKLGKFLAKVRIDNGLTLLEFAANVGVSSAFLSMFEQGEKHLAFSRAGILARYLDELGADVKEFERLIIADRITRALPHISDAKVDMMTELALPETDLLNTALEADNDNT